MLCEPKYKWAKCSSCVFVGRDEDADIWYCDRSRQPMVITVWGEGEDDYWANDLRVFELWCKDADDEIKQMTVYKSWQFVNQLLSL